MTTRERNELRKRRRLVRMMKQKLLGLVIFIISLVTLYVSMVFEMDGTAYMILAPFGMLLMLSKRRWIQ